MARIIGLPGVSQLLTGTHRRDHIYGDTTRDLSASIGGNDTIVGLAGQDFLVGDAGDDVKNGAIGGNDTIEGGNDRDSIYGDAKNDLRMQAMGGNDIINAGAGNNFVYGDAGDDILYHSHGGNDTITAHAGRDTIAGDAGDGIVKYSSGGNDTIDAGAGDDVVAGDALDTIEYHSKGGNDTIYGGLGDDELFGDAKDDVMRYSSGGNDNIEGNEGDDLIAGDAGDDIVFYSTGGNDTLHGNQGHDRIYGDARDIIKHYSHGGNDILYGDDGKDHIAGDSGAGIRLHSSGGNDMIYGGAADDWLTGDTWGYISHYSFGGDDYIDGGAGNDVIYGDASKWIYVHSHGGDDHLFGGAGDDIIYGDTKYFVKIGSTGGDDTIDGGSGNDTMFGNDGNDTFLYHLEENANYEDFIDGFWADYDIIKFNMTQTTWDNNQPWLYNALVAYDTFLDTFASTLGVTFDFDDYNGDNPALLNLRARHIEDAIVIVDGNTFTLDEVVTSTVDAVDDMVMTSQDSAINPTLGNVINNDIITILPASLTEVNGSASNVGTTLNLTYGDLIIQNNGDFTYLLDNSSLAVKALAENETMMEVATTYTLSNTLLQDTATLSIKVTGINDAPMAGDDVYQVLFGESLSIDVLANDIDIDNGTVLTFQSVMLTLNLGTVSGASMPTINNGVFTYDANSTTAGIDTFVYTVNDNGTVPLSDMATVTIEVGCDVVNTFIDGVNANDGINTLREAIICANNNPGADIIHLGSGVYSLTLGSGDTPDTETDDLDITDTLTIIGADDGSTVIDANQLFRIFHVAQNVSLTLENITLTQGSDILGSAVNVESGATLNVHGTSFISNLGQNGIVSQGGAVYLANNSTLNVDGLFDSGSGDLIKASVFQGNQALLGGAIYATGSNVDINIDNSLFTDNSTYQSNGVGGAILLETSGNNTLDINNSIFSHNSSAGGGSAVSMGTFTFYSANISINDSVFIHNGNDLSTGFLPQSGAVYLGRGIHNIDNSLFLYNTAGTLASNNAGAVAINSNVFNPMTISNSTFAYNQGYAGAINHFGRDLTIVNSTLSDNTAYIAGGIYTPNTSFNRVDLINSTVANNHVSQSKLSSGGIINARNFDIQSSIIINNEVNDVANLSLTSPSSTSLGFNMIGNIDSGLTTVATDIIAPTTPGLSALAKNGGLVLEHDINTDGSINDSSGYYQLTHALLPNSEALDAGTSAGFNSDQRGETTPVNLTGIANADDADDIGAFELQLTEIIAADDGFVISPGGTLTAENVLADNGNGSDFQTSGAVPIIVSHSNTSNGILNFNSTTGDFDYTPSIGFLGKDSFTYTISDGMGNTDLATVSIDVCSLEVNIFSDEFDLSNNNMSLREAIACANSTPGLNTIQLDSGTYTLDLDNFINLDSELISSDDFDIFDDLVIVGAADGSTIIDGGGLRVFEVFRDVTLKLENITIRNSTLENFDNADGAAIKGDHGSQINLVGVSMIDNPNYAIFTYGGLNVSGLMDGVTLTRASVFINNGLGAIRQSNDTDESSHLIITDSLFENNNGTTIATDTVAEVDISNTIIRNNSSDSISTSTIAYSGGQNDFTLNHVLIANNTTAATSAVSYDLHNIDSAASRIFNISDSLFVNNLSNGVNASGALNINGNVNSPGAIVTIDNTTFANNKVGLLPQNGAGAIRAQDADSITITNSTFTNNQGPQAGAIYTANVDNITINNSTITDNTSLNEASAGGIWLTPFSASLPGSHVEVFSSVIANNKGGTDILLSSLTNASFNSGGYNIVGTFDTEPTAGGTFPSATGDMLIGNGDPGLNGLGEYGGIVLPHDINVDGSINTALPIAQLTQAVLPTSIALDAGSSGTSTTDERGEVRPINSALAANSDDGADVGAFELQAQEIFAVDDEFGVVNTGMVNANVISDNNGNGVDFTSDGSTPIIIAHDLSGVTNGIINFNPLTGDLDYTPNAGFIGQETFTYTISDGSGNTDSATVTIDVCSIAVNVHDDLAVMTDAYVTLREAVNCANEITGLNTIELGSGTYTLNLSDGSSDSDTDNLFNDLDILDDLIIRGASDGSTTIEMTSTDRMRLFEVFNGAKLTLENITIKGGNSTNEGGAIRLHNGSLDIIGSSFIGNSSPNAGSAIYSANGDINILPLLDASNVIRASVFQQNTSVSSGGSTVFVAVGSDLTVDRALFSENINGVIQAQGSSQVNIDRSIFSENSGGTILNMGTNANLTLANSVIEANNGLSASALLSTGEHTIDNSLFVNNSGTSTTAGVFVADASANVDINDSTFVNNSTTATFSSSAGAISNRGNLEINNSTISSNSGGSVGGIYNLLSLDVNNSTIVGNNGADVGGIQQGFGSLVTTDLFSSIVADNNGLDIQVSSFSGTLSSSGYNIIGEVDSTPTAGASFPSTTGDIVIGAGDPGLAPVGDYGGVVLDFDINTDGTVDLSHGYNQLTNAVNPLSVALDAGSAGSETTDQRGEDRTVNSALAGNSDDGTDSGAFELQDDDVFAIDDNYLIEVDTVLMGNVLSGDGINGPDFQADGGTPIIIGSDVSNVDDGLVVFNPLTGDFTYTPPIGLPANDSFTYMISDGNGNTSTATVNINVCSLEVNTLSDLSLTLDATNSLREAVICANNLIGDNIIQLSSGTYNLNLDDSPTLDDSTAQFDDLDITDTTGSLTIRGANDGSTVIDAGDLFRIFEVHNGAKLILENVTLSNGNAQIGGAINVDAGTLEVYGSRIIDSTSTSNGGALHMNANSTVLIEGIMDDTSGALQQASVLMGNNTTSGRGGAIYNIGGNLDIHHSLIHDNSSDFSNGGGIYSTIGGDLTVSHSVISNNSGRGGGIEFSASTGDTFILDNSVVIGNVSTSTSTSAGGITLGQGTTTISGSLIADNMAGRGAGGILVTTSSALVDIRDSAVVNNAITNMVTFSAGGLYNSGTTTITNSTFSQNEGSDAGAILNFRSLSISQSTFSENFVDQFVASTQISGGIFHRGTSLQLDNSILVGNTDSVGDNDLFGLVPIISQGDNMIGATTGSFTAGAGDIIAPTTAGLGPLANNGGVIIPHTINTDGSLDNSTHFGQLTYDLLLGSQAIDATSDSSSSLTTDQRGEPFDRVEGGFADMGALEVQGSATSFAAAISHYQLLFIEEYDIPAGAPIEGAERLVVTDTISNDVDADVGTHVILTSTLPTFMGNSYEFVFGTNSHDGSTVFSSQLPVAPVNDVVVVGSHGDDDMVGHATQNTFFFGGPGVDAATAGSGDDVFIDALDGYVSFNGGAGNDILIINNTDFALADFTVLEDGSAAGKWTITNIANNALQIVVEAVEKIIFQDTSDNTIEVLHLGSSGNETFELENAIAAFDENHFLFGVNKGDRFEFNDVATDAGAPGLADDLNALFPDLSNVNVGGQDYFTFEDSTASPMTLYTVQVPLSTDDTFAELDSFLTDAGVGTSGIYADDGSLF